MEILLKKLFQPLNYRLIHVLRNKKLMSVVTICRQIIIKTTFDFEFRHLDTSVCDHT